MNLFFNRDEFYKALWDNYRAFSKENVDKCFYYGYLKVKKDIKAASVACSGQQLRDYSKEKRMDKYILLHGAYLAAKNDVITESEYKDIFKKLLSTKRSGRKKYLSLLEETIDKANEEFERELLAGCVRDFFDNEGFKATGEQQKSANRHRKEKNGYTDIVEMLYDYIYKYMGETLTENASPLSVEINEEYINKCLVLYNAAKKAKQTEAFIPLHFDRNSGAGIFIVGKKLFDKNLDGYEKISGDCAICILYFSDINEKAGSNYPEEWSITMMVKVYENIETAFNEFNILSDKSFENYAYINYPVSKEYFEADKIDNCFKSRLISTVETASQINKIIAEQMEKEDQMIAFLQKNGI